MESFDQTWDLVLDICRDRMTDIAFNTWISKIIPYRFDLENKSIELQVINEL